MGCMLIGRLSRSKLASGDTTCLTGPRARMRVVGAFRRQHPFLPFQLHGASSSAALLLQLAGVFQVLLTTIETDDDLCSFFLQGVSRQKDHEFRSAATQGYSTGAQVCSVQFDPNFDPHTIQNLEVHAYPRKGATGLSEAVSNCCVLICYQFG